MRKHVYANRRAKLIDFWLGFLGFFVVNIAVYAVIQAISNTHPNYGLLISALLLLANIATPIVLAFIRDMIAFGILIAFASALMLAVVEGVFYTVSDFAGGEVSGFEGGTSGNVVITYAFLIAGFIVTAVVDFFIIRAIHRRVN